LFKHFFYYHPDQEILPFPNQRQKRRAGGVAQVLSVPGLPSKREILNSNCSAARKQTNRNKDQKKLNPHTWLLVEEGNDLRIEIQNIFLNCGYD
jgi:hypothetical protein